MKSLSRLGTQPASLPLAADDILEFHAARLLLLMKVCGTGGRIDGLTKMAKLDFFTRYPEFFEVALAAIAKTPSGRDIIAGHHQAVEASMVRHHYGPWDKRYYHVLAHLEAKELISVLKEKKSYQISLTALGRESAKRLAERPTFAPLLARLKKVKAVFGTKSGSYLKDLIYQLFDAEVSRREMGRVIQR